jgi:hypothetical protein
MPLKNRQWQWQDEHQSIIRPRCDARSQHQHSAWVMLAIAEKGPEIVPRILAQLEDSGQVAAMVTAKYQQAKALLDTLP